MRDEPSDPDDLRGLIAAAARLLPAQGPISSFVALNPLHGFEDRPFPQAVEEAARLMHAQPYLEEMPTARHLRMVASRLPTSMRC